MVLKVYNKLTNKFDPISIKTSQSYTDKSGSINTYFEEFKDNNNSIQEALDTKISKKGDIVKGSIEFGNGFGLVGTSKNNLIVNSSSIQYCQSNNSSTPGYFKVINKTSDTTDIDSNPNEDSFNLMCDNNPTENSKNLLTSGTLYEILQELDSRISRLENK